MDNTQGTTTRVVVCHSRDLGWHVTLDGLPLQGANAVHLGATEAEELAGVVERAVAGEQDALDKLERDGIEPPVLEVDDTPMPTCFHHDWTAERDHALVGVYRQCKSCRTVEVVA